MFSVIVGASPFVAERIALGWISPRTSAVDPDRPTGHPYALGAAGFGGARRFSDSSNDPYCICVAIGSVGGGARACRRSLRRILSRPWLAIAVGRNCSSDKRRPAIRSGVDRSLGSGSQCGYGHAHRINGSRSSRKIPSGTSNTFGWLIPCPQYPSSPKHSPWSPQTTTIVQAVAL